MDFQLTGNELHKKQQLLQDYSSAQEAIALLSQNNGRLNTTFDQLWEEKIGVPTFGEGKLLWQSTLKVLRQELFLATPSEACGQTSCLNEPPGRLRWPQPENLQRGSRWCCRR